MRKDYHIHTQNNKLPVITTWSLAKQFADWLSKRSKQKFRLPTEKEWEFAARAGTDESRYWGNNPDWACRYANVNDESLNSQHKCNDGFMGRATVGRFEPNPFGLYDMLGNVWEWTSSAYSREKGIDRILCENFYSTGTDHIGASAMDNQTDIISGKDRKISKRICVIRGGSYQSGPKDVRASRRKPALDDSAGAFFLSTAIGFRLVKD